MPAELTSPWLLLPSGSPAGRAIAGAIQASEGGITVDLDGTFQQPSALFGVSATYPVVHGTLQGDDAVSPHGVYQTATHMGGYFRQTWGVTYCIVGEHRPRDPTFDEMHFEFDHLADWLGSTGLSTVAGQDGPRSLTDHQFATR